MKIPLCRPFWGKEEEKVVVQALQSTIGTGDGLFTKKLIAQLQKLTGAKYVLPTTSCTHGLELAISAYDLQPGEEIILPSFTMSSTANCVVLSGATPIFADINQNTFCINPADIENKITPKTRGIIVMHYAGMPTEMKKIKTIANKHKLFIIEDAAHSIGAKYFGKMLGNWGNIGVYSFHGTKNVCCGEGGAVLTNDKNLADKMEIYRANGTNRKAFLEGIVDKYSWVGKGTSYFLSDILAAMLTEQVKKIPKINSARIKIADRYLKSFSSYTDKIQLPIVPANTIPNWHIFAIRFKNTELRSRFISFMRGKGIEVSYHYVPLHNAPMGISLAHQKNIRLPITESVASTLVRLPIYPDLKKSEQDYIIKNAVNFLKTI